MTYASFLPGPSKIVSSAPDRSVYLLANWKGIFSLFNKGLTTCGLVLVSIPFFMYVSSILQVHECTLRLVATMEGSLDW
jgi:hypothetical protein